MVVDPISITAVLGACGYYFFAWMVAGRNPKRGTVVPIYNPPQHLSPAMIRYVWKARFDDRTFWASVLSLVAKGLATLESDVDVAVLRPKAETGSRPLLPPEEEVLFIELHAGSKRKAMRINMLDENTALVANEMANQLREAAVDTWFIENRNYVKSGVVVSVVVACLVARPYGKDEWMAFVLGLSVMAPGAFYLLFLVLRIRDSLLAIRDKVTSAVVRRTALLVALAAPCVGAVVLGSVVLTVNFGWRTIAATVFLTGLTLVFAQIIKAPTQEGQVLIDQIDGFRLFLQSVERQPMDRPDAPGDHAGVYEKYLPYAVALEVDQQWGDRLVALTSTLHRAEALVAAHSFYLGMWNGKPIEMVFKPQPPKGGRF